MPLGRIDRAHRKAERDRASGSLLSLGMLSVNAFELEGSVEFKAVAPLRHVLILYTCKV
jgi:hypothetical protein